MHREEDIDIIQKNIDNIIQEADMIYKMNIEPTIDESKEVFKEILSFIKNKKKIIYGGYAQNSLILLKNKNDGFYNEFTMADIEFYSYEPLKDLIELCDYLHSKKFKYVQGSEGLHEGTYKIYVNFVNYCDIAYLPKNIYDNCPFIISNNIKFIDPIFMLIDIYRVFTDPMTSYWRLEKSFKRYIKLYKYYPIEKYKINNNILFKPTNSEENLSKIRKHIIHKSNYIVIGTYAYNYYIKKSDMPILKINYYEIITENLKIEAIKIYKKLMKLFNNKITVNEYSQFYEFFDYRVEFLYEDNVILKVYNNNSRCIVYNESEIKKTKFGTCQLVQLYLLSNYNYLLVNRNKTEANNYINMFLNLNTAKNNYLIKHNLSVLDTSPFKEFRFKCIGESIKLDRLKNLDIMNKIKLGKQIKFRYTPLDKQGIAPEYTFKNLSGNKVINNKYLIIKI